MSLANFLRRVLGSSTPSPAASHSYNFFSEKTGANHDYYHYGSYKKPKGKSKSDKKHAILSALTLLSFLFFLNILQNCIREQSQTRGTLMMFGSSSPTASQGKYRPNNQEEEGDIPTRRKRSSLNYKYQENEKASQNEHFAGRKSRNLLGIFEKKETTASASNRRLKFIHNYKSVRNWTNALSQISDKDLEDQKLKTLNLTSYWKSKELPQETRYSETSTPSNTFYQKSRLSATEIPFLYRKIKKREGTSTLDKNFHDTTTTKISWENRNLSRFSQLENTAQLQNHSQKQETKFTPSPLYQVNGTWKGFSQVVNVPTNSQQREKIKKTHNLQRLQQAAHDFKENLPFTATTPRNMRSDYSSTVRSADYDDYERVNDQSSAQSVGLDLNTFQTYPVYNYYNHRQNIYRQRENETTESVTPEISTKHESLEIDRIHNDFAGSNAHNSLFYPTKITPQHSKYPHLDKTKYALRRPDHHTNKPPYHLGSQVRYRYSPYRKTSTYEPSRFHEPMHDDYIVVARYPQDEESSFDISKFLWTMFTSFARPLTNLVPGLAKDNNDEPQCYDLLVCEAQRVSKFMGPTAEALTTTLGTLLSWAVTEDTRQTVIEALNSGRENTCQQQIRDCEDRSGGKSAMTVIAQVMEIKLR